MSALIDTGPPHRPTMEEIIEARDWGRQEFGCGEDNWGMKECTLVRERLPKCFHETCPVEVKKWCSLSRRNKLKTTHNARKLGRKIKKAAEQHERYKERCSDGRSERYEAYIASDEWRAVVIAHHKSCNHRCQLCGAMGSLDGHHTPEGYRNLGKEKSEDILSLCRQCHRVADLLRECGKIESRDIQSVGLPLLPPSDCSDIFGIEIDCD